MNILDELFDLLSDERRRYALYYLEQQDEPISVEELAEKVAEWETSDSNNAILEERFERIKLEFYHTDLPKASNASYVRYDRREGIVELSRMPPEVGAIIHVAKVIERPERNL